MKYRSGFVANSSSSSFMCAIGYIKNRQVFDEWVRKNKITLDHYYYTIHDATDFYGELELDENKLRFNCCCDDVIETTYHPELSEVFTMDIAHHEGDDGFWNGDYMEYDIDLNYFDDKEQKIYTEISDESISGLIDVQKIFGAKRIG